MVPVNLNQFRAGDLVSFAGTAWQSRIIAFRTGSWSRWISHVGILFHRGDEWMVGESTTLNTDPCEITGKMTEGVQAHRLLKKVQTYPGKVWVTPLSAHRRLTGNESKKLTEWITDSCVEGVKYDVDGALLSGTTFLKRWTYPDPSKLFCSEMVHSLYVDLKRLAPGNSLISPAGLERLCRMAGLTTKPVRVK